MKRVLVIGRSGQLARALLKSAPADCAVQAWGREQLDLAELASIAPALREWRPDCVINAGAYTAVDRAESEPEAAFRLNRDAVAALGRAGAGLGCAVIHVSTDFVFDGGQSRPYRPQDPCAPLGVYGRSKREGELALLEAMPDAAIVRTAWVYSAHGHNFMRTMLKLMAEREELGVVCDQIGTPTSAHNLAQVLWRMVEKGVHRGIWHYSDAGVASWYDFACAIYARSRERGLLHREVRIRPIATEDYPTPAQRPPFSVLDSHATWETLQWQPPHWQRALENELTMLQQGS